jgi:ketosteroid isomerase-like protein
MPPRNNGTQEAGLDTTDIAHDVVALCKAGRFDDVGEKYWADDVLNVEAMGDQPETRGKQAIRQKSDWWVAAHEIHSVEVSGPYINGDQFAIRFIVDATVRESGHHQVMDEIGVYTVRDGRIIEERFLYAM